MLAGPTCPAPQAGAPVSQIDHRVACWAPHTLSGAGLRAWLRLLTHFRNDRPIPQLSARRLALITGLSLGSAHKVLPELRKVLRFAEDDEEDLPEDPPGADPPGAAAWRSGHEHQSSRAATERSRNERLTPSQSAQSVHGMNATVHGMNANRSRNERLTISIQGHLEK